MLVKYTTSILLLASIINAHSSPLNSHGRRAMQKLRLRQDEGLITSLPPILPPLTELLPEPSASVFEAPVESSAAPEPSAAPVESSEAPAVSSDAPTATSDAPAVSSDVPVQSSDAPAVSSETPALSSDAPAPSASEAPLTSAPTTSDAPVETPPPSLSEILQSLSQALSSAVEPTPVESSAPPVESSTAPPVESSAAPTVESSAAAPPVESSVAPVEPSAAPTESSAAPPVESSVAPPPNPISSILASLSQVISDIVTPSAPPIQTSNVVIVTVESTSFIGTNSLPPPSPTVSVPPVVTESQSQPPVVTGTESVSQPPIVSGTESVSQPPIITSVSQPPIATGTESVSQPPIITSVSQPPIVTGTESVSQPPIITSVSQPPIVTGTDSVSRPPVITSVSQPPIVTGTESVSQPPIITSVSQPPIVTGTDSVSRPPVITSVSQPPIVTGTDSVSRPPTVTDSISIAFPTTLEGSLTLEILTETPSITRTRPQASLQSEYTFLTATQLIFTQQPSATESVTFSDPDQATTSVSLVSAAPNAQASVAPLPSGVPSRIFPQTQLTTKDDLSAYTIVSILFDSGLNWPFVSSKWESASQIFGYFPVTIANALDIDTDQVKSYALQVYVPKSYTGPAELAQLRTMWVGYIQTDLVDTLAAQIKAKRSAFYTASPAASIPHQLASHVDAGFALNSVAAPPGMGGGGAAGGDNAGSSVAAASASKSRENAIIGVVTALGAVALIVLGFLIYRSYKRRQELAHRRLSDPIGGNPNQFMGARPDGRDFDQDSIGGQRRRSFYYAEDSLRGTESEQQQAQMSQRRPVLASAISAPKLTASSMQW